MSPCLLFIAINAILVAALLATIGYDFLLPRRPKPAQIHTAAPTSSLQP